MHAIRRWGPESTFSFSGASKRTSKINTAHGTQVEWGISPTDEKLWSREWLLQLNSSVQALTESNSQHNR